MNGEVVVIGAGCAGLSAAVRLAGAGRKVTVVEEAPRLGGRATSFADRASGARLDNGQHVIFGCYRETFAFLRAIGTAALAPLDRSLEVTMAATGGRTSTLRCPSWPPPWHLVAGLLRWSAVPLRDRVGAVRVVRAATRGSDFETSPSYEDSIGTVRSSDWFQSPSPTVAQWLKSLNQSDAICRWLWYPLALAALNQSPDTASAAPFIAVLRELLGGGADAAAIALPSVPLAELYAEPAARFIESCGGAVIRRATASIVLDADGAIAGVRAGDLTIAAPIVVSAVPWHALGRLWFGEPPAAMKLLVDNAAGLGGEPIVTVNLWFDRPVLTSRFVGFVDGTMHWAFDKGQAPNTSEHHLSIVASGATALLRLDNSELSAIAERDVRAMLPGAADASVIRSLVVREPRATFSLVPDAPARPGTSTPIRGFFLAGDWVDTGLPGTIESAVRSGHKAAEEALALGPSDPGTLGP